MGKRERRFERIAEFKDRFRQFPTDSLRQQLNTGMLQPEAAIALREVLEQREQATGTGEFPDAGPGHR